MNRELHQHQRHVVEQQRYFKRHSVYYALIIAFAVLAPLVWLSWKVRGVQWVKNSAFYMADTITLIFINYFKRQLIQFLGQK